MWSHLMNTRSIGVAFLFGFVNLQILSSEIDKNNALYKGPKKNATKKVRLEMKLRSKGNKKLSLFSYLNYK